MEFLSCNCKANTTVILNTVKFWAINSYEHIEVLLNAYKGSGAVLPDLFESTLQNLYNKFKDISTRCDSITSTTALKCLLKDFLNLNNDFITLLQRLKFEAFNGFPILFETVYHFLYEQEYTANLFKPFFYVPKQNNFSVVANTFLQNVGYNQRTINCVYNNIYFWSLIGSEHTSIIATVSPIENGLPAATKELLLKLNNEFNDTNFKLSNIFYTLNKYNLLEVFDSFNNTNDEFLALLEDFNSPDSKYLPAEIKAQLPPLFFGVLNHIINEHNYIKSLNNDYKNFLTTFSC